MTADAISFQSTAGSHDTPGYSELSALPARGTSSMLVRTRRPATSPPGRQRRPIAYAYLHAATPSIPAAVCPAGDARRSEALEACPTQPAEEHMCQLPLPDTKSFRSSPCSHRYMRIVRGLPAVAKTTRAAPKSLKLIPGQSDSSEGRGLRRTLSFLDVSACLRLRERYRGVPHFSVAASQETDQAQD